MTNDTTTNYTQEELNKIRAEYLETNKEIVAIGTKLLKQNSMCNVALGFSIISAIYFMFPTPLKIFAIIFGKKAGLKCEGFFGHYFADVRFIANYSKLKLSAEDKAKYIKAINDANDAIATTSEQVKLTAELDKKNSDIAVVESYEE